MNKYVVAYLSRHDCEIKQELIEANSAFEAAISYLGGEPEDYASCASLKELQEQGSNMYFFISVFDLSKHERTSRKGGGLQNQVAGFDSQARVQ